MILARILGIVLYVLGVIMAVKPDMFRNGSVKDGLLFMFGGGITFFISAIF